MSDRFTPPEGRDAQTLHQVLARRAASRGDAPWITGEARSWTYRDVDSMSNRVANGLGALGVAKGDTVLVMLPDCVEFIAAWCGLAKLGAVQVPVNTHLRGSVLSHVVNDSRARTMIVHARFLDRLAGVGAGRVESFIVLGGMPGGAPGGWPAALSRLEHTPFGTLLEASDAPAGDGPAATDLVAVLYTSGTTGPSKGVMISHIQAYEYARSVVELLELAPDDVYYAPLPLFHIAGQWGVAYAACLIGAQAVLARPFSAGAYWPDVRRHRATATFLLGAMANFLFQQPEAEDDADNPLERALVVPLLPEIEAFKRRFGCLVSTTWGATEFNVPTRSTFTLANDRTCGRVAEDRYEVRIVDALDREVPPGVPGEAVVRPREPWLTMIGYWGRPDWTVAAWRNLWLHTGDMLMRDEEGNLYFVDRTKDAIRRRGENISSMEVEQEIVAHPRRRRMRGGPGRLRAHRAGGHGGGGTPPRRGARPRRAHRVPHPAHGVLHDSPLRGDSRRAAQDPDREDPEVHVARARAHPGDVGSGGGRDQAAPLRRPGRGSVTGSATCLCRPMRSGEGRFVNPGEDPRGRVRRRRARDGGRKNERAGGVAGVTRGSAGSPGERR